MLFTSLQYILFLPAVVLLYWLLPFRARLFMLLVASYFFYMSWMPAFLLLIFGMTVFNFFWGKILHGAVERATHGVAPTDNWWFDKKTIFGVGIAANLLCLGYFKYTNLLLQSLSAVFRANPAWHADIILPIAISFFIFEFIHYLFEIYRGNEPMKSFTLFALFAAFFPTQIAGPIKRYKDFETQMLEKKFPKLRYFDEGITLIVIGMAKKILLANNLATLVDMGYKIPGYCGAPELWLLAYAFAFQIYFDFSAYTDIARGSAMLFGYKIPINFDIPYIANNMSNFWRRWHISLSTWLRDYLFIPLGGSRDGKWKTNRNLFLTMALGGLWHGASWNFMVWGIFHGLALIVHREFSEFKEKVSWLKKFVDSKFGYVLSVLITFHAVCIGWVFFRMQDIGMSFKVVQRMLLLHPMRTSVETEHLVLLKPELPVFIPVAILMVLALLAVMLPLGFAQERRWHKLVPGPLQGAFCALLVIIMLIFLPSGNQPFIYFQF